MRIYTTYEISQSLQVNITTVMSWINQGKLLAYKTPGGHRRVFHDDLIAFLKKYKMPIPPEFQKKYKRVLVVDDDPQVARLINRLLKKIDAKLEIETAKDGFEAGRLVEIFSPDLVILDLMLPGVDGFTVCQKIRKDKKKKDVKILAISGQNTKENEAKVLKCGADAFLAKPFQVEVFNKFISRLLSL